MARTVRGSGMKEVPLSEIKDDLSRFLREAETQEIIITRHGKPAGVLIGFESEEDWFEYRLEHDPRLTGAKQPACGTWDQARRHRKRIVPPARRRPSVHAMMSKLSDRIAWTRARYHSATAKQ